MEQAYKYGSAVLGAAASFLYGGWSGLLTILLALAVLDYISGFAAAAYQGNLSSKVGRWGIARKAGMFAVVAVAHMADSALGVGNGMIMNAAISFYMANELLSVLENAGRLDIPIPPALQKAIEVLKGKNKEG